MSDKPHEPSKKRIEEARKKGDIPRSQLLTGWASLAGGSLGILCAVPMIHSDIISLIQIAFDPSSPNQVCLRLTGLIVVELLAFVLLPAAFCAVAIELRQVGCNSSVALLAPQFSRCDATQGMKRIGGGVKKVPLMLLKVTLFLWIGIILLSEIRDDLLTVGILSFDALQRLWAAKLSRVVYAALILLFILAIVDLLVARHQFTKRNSMSVDEVRREHKDQEGDPHIKHRRKALHQAMIMQDVAGRVRRAKVIVVKSA